ncbi:MAG: ribonuclease III [Bacillota bacterium]|nr:ribonuclease III [Bacillota bacterium]
MEKKLSIYQLEESLNVSFDNKSLIETALTHSSFANQNKNVDYNERLEFLGDSVLQLIISEYLFKNYTEKSEGELTKTRALIVCESSLHEIAKQWELGKFISMSKGEELTGGRTRISILADCVEAVIAAVYLDKGLEYARKFVLDNFRDIVAKAAKDEIILDYKTKLQEIMQQKGDVSIRYNLVKYEGPPHRRKFYVEVDVQGKTEGYGEGYSKKEAEQNAAAKALQHMNVVSKVQQ